MTLEHFSFRWIRIFHRSLCFAALSYAKPAATFAESALMRALFLGLLAAGAAGLTDAASAADAVGAADALPGSLMSPQWRVGSEWTYSDGYGLRVSATDGVITTFERTDAPGQWFSRYGFLRQDAKSGTAERQTIYRTIAPNHGLQLNEDHPLTFQREYLTNGEQQVHATSWTAEGHETITVPAGTFDCWVIVWRTRSLKSNWTGFERWWYSPEVQHYVRMEYKYGEGPTASRVLMRYAVVRNTSAPVAPAAPAEISQIEGIAAVPITKMTPEAVAAEIIAATQDYPSVLDYTIETPATQPEDASFSEMTATAPSVLAEDRIAAPSRPAVSAKSLVPTYQGRPFRAARLSRF